MDVDQATVARHGYGNAAGCERPSAPVGSSPPTVVAGGDELNNDALAFCYYGKNANTQLSIIFPI